MDEQKEPLSEEQLQEDLEITHTDKLVGVFTEPGKTFGKMSLLPPKTVDWLLPVFLTFLLAVISNFLMMGNPAIKYQIVEKQMEQIEKSFDEAVENGQMTREQADAQLEQTREMMSKQSGMIAIFSTVGILIGGFIVFFLVATVFFLVSRFALKGEGGYSTALVGYGLPYYIGVFQVIVTVIAALAMGKLMTGTSVAAFTGADTSTFAGFLLTKLDPISIWFYAVVSIGLAKMFKARSTAPYFIWVFGLWLGVGILLFFLSQSMPFLKNFIM